jgi:hypothetical protein
MANGITVNGIPVKFAIYDEKGDATGIETPVFATVRKCPALRGSIKGVHLARIRLHRAEIEADRALVAMSQAVDMDAAEQSAAAAEDRRQDATAAMLAAMRDFAVAGFKGAGYVKADAERYADMIGPDQFATLHQAAMTGCGVADFTKPRS